jgi:hypothetical protein
MVTAVRARSAGATDGGRPLHATHDSTLPDPTSTPPSVHKVAGRHTRSTFITISHPLFGRR